MILKLKSPCELYTKEGRKEFRPGNYDIEKNGILTGHWFLLGLLQGDRAEILEKDDKPYYKHLPGTDAAKEAEQIQEIKGIDISKPFSWEQVVGKEEVEEIISPKVPEKKEEIIEEEKKENIEVSKKRLKRK